MKYGEKLLSINNTKTGVTSREMEEHRERRKQALVCPQVSPRSAITVAVNSLLYE